MKFRPDTLLKLTEGTKEKIAAKRRALGLTVYQAAVRAGVTIDVYRRAMNGFPTYARHHGSLTEWANRHEEIVH